VRKGIPVGHVTETQFKHFIMIPFYLEGEYTVKSIVSEGEYTINDQIAVIETAGAMR
jgi:V/A-type H+/Na+-transporting ATPase subunit A